MKTVSSESDAELVHSQDLKDDCQRVTDGQMISQLPAVHLTGDVH